MVERDKINHLKVTVNEADEGTRIMKWLVHRYRNIVQSKECCKQSFRRKEITINGETVEETRILHAGDVVEVKYNRGLVELERLKMVPVDIRYQDAHIAIVWKAPGQSFGIFERALPYALERSKDDPPLWCVYTMQKAGSGLLVVTKSEEAKADLNELYKEGHDFDVTMRVICHGHVPADLLDSLNDTDSHPPQPTTNDKATMTTENGKDGDEEDDAMEEATPAATANDLLKSLKIVQITRSNNADYLSTLDLSLKPPVSTIAIRSLFYYHSSYPIVGNSTYTKFLKSSRDKGLCMSVTRVSFIHPVTGKRMTWTADEPDKFELLRAREQKFWRRKLDEKLAALEKAGLLTTGSSGQDSGGLVDAIDDNQKEEDGRPLAYIVGEKVFHGLSFKVTDACLIPRPSTETLVDATLAHLLGSSNSTLKKKGREQPPRVLDIGTGCGNVLLSILHASASDVKGVGVDISNDALAVAQENQAMLGIAPDRVEWVQRDMALLDDQLGMFDVVVCNPPYLNIKTIEQQKKEFRMLAHEPAQALFADDDGYGWYKVLSEVAPTIMHRRSKLVLECGKGMMDRVKLIMSGWKTVEVRKDKQGWDRCLVLELE